jgi:hypothetical protein
MIIHNRMPMKIKLVLKSILCLFGTFLHELSHFAAALILGRPEGFSVVPRIEGDVFVFGEVRAKVRYKVLSVFIAGAPLIWWALLLIMARQVFIVPPAADVQGFNASIPLQRLQSFSVHYAFSLWLFFQLLWAGRLSLKDIRTCIAGFLSPSGLILISLAGLLLQLTGYIH